MRGDRLRIGATHWEKQLFNGTVVTVDDFKVQRGEAGTEPGVLISARTEDGRKVIFRHDEIRDWYGNIRLDHGYGWTGALSLRPHGQMARPHGIERGERRHFEWRFQAQMASWNRKWPMCQSVWIARALNTPRHLDNWPLSSCYVPVASSAKLSFSGWGT